MLLGCNDTNLKLVFALHKSRTTLSECSQTTAVPCTSSDSLCRERQCMSEPCALVFPVFQSRDSKSYKDPQKGWSQSHDGLSSKSYDKRVKKKKKRSEKSDSHQWDWDSSKRSTESRPLKTGMLRSRS